MTVSSSDALEMADKFLGKGYIERGLKDNPNFGRFVSSDGNYQVRMGKDDLLGNHMGGPHINIDRIKPKKKIHLYFQD